jgi:hypothetical protein
VDVRIEKTTKFKLLDEVSFVLSQFREGTPSYRKTKSTILKSIVSDLLDLGIAPPYFQKLTINDYLLLLRHWEKQGLSVSTIRNKLGIFRWFLSKINHTLDYPPYQDLGLEKKRTRKAAIPPIEIIEQIFHPITKTIIEFEIYFGLTRLESIRINLNSALRNDDLYISRKLSHNSKERFISVMSAPQKNAIKSRKQILGQYEVLSQFASEAELSKYCSMEIKYCGYDPTAKLRSIYAANTLAKLQKNGYTKEKAYEAAMLLLGFTRKEKFLEFIF